LTLHKAVFLVNCVGLVQTIGELLIDDAGHGAERCERSVEEIDRE
jgi:hypothetical protein